MRGFASEAICGQNNEKVEMNGERSPYFPLMGMKSSVRCFDGQPPSVGSKGHRTSSKSRDEQRLSIRCLCVCTCKAGNISKQQRMAAGIEANTPGLLCTATSSRFKRTIGQTLYIAALLPLSRSIDHELCAATTHGVEETNRRYYSGYLI